MDKLAATRSCHHKPYVLQLLLKTGAEGKQTVFLFADNQIKDESFMEDISMILNTGDVPNLYPSDEKADIIEKMQLISRNEVCHFMPTHMFLVTTMTTQCHVTRLVLGVKKPCQFLPVAIIAFFYECNVTS